MVKLSAKQATKTYLYSKLKLRNMRNEMRRSGANSLHSGKQSRFMHHLNCSLNVTALPHD